MFGHWGHLQGNMKACRSELPQPTNITTDKRTVLLLFLCRSPFVRRPPQKPTINNASIYRHQCCYIDKVRCDPERTSSFLNICKLIKKQYYNLLILKKRRTWHRIVDVVGVHRNLVDLILTCYVYLNGYASDRYSLARCS